MPLGFSRGVDSGGADTPQESSTKGELHDANVPDTMLVQEFVEGSTCGV